MRSFAWGGESIAVSRLEVNGALLGEPLIITVKGDNAFTLQNDDFGIELSGTVGELLSSEAITIFVAELVGAEGTRFEVSKQAWLKSVQDVGRALSVSEVGRQSGIIRINYQNTDPDAAENI